MFNYKMDKLIFYKHIKPINKKNKKHGDKTRKGSQSIHQFLAAMAFTFVACLSKDKMTITRGGNIYICSTHSTRHCKKYTCVCALLLNPAPRILHVPQKKNRGEKKIAEIKMNERVKCLYPPDTTTIKIT